MHGVNRMYITITMCEKYQVYTSDIWTEVPSNEQVIADKIGKYVQEGKTFYVNHVTDSGKCKDTFYFEKGIRQW